jgi:hypothetical protein
MSHFVNANPLNYDAKYPQTADTHTNDEAKIEIMKKNIGKDVMFQIEDGSQFYGKIASVPNSAHYRVIVNQNESPWEWYAREEAVRFVIDPLQKTSIM